MLALLIGTSGADFRSRMNLRSEKIKAQVQAKIIKYGTTLLQTLVTDTPILTGQARANWQAAIGQPDNDFIGKSGLTSDPKQLAHRLPDTVSPLPWNALAVGVVQSYQPGQVLYIYSNLPYIEYLNEGSSRQAPSGFVESAIMKASAAVRS